MSISTILLLILILIIDVVLFIRDIKNKLIFVGINKYIIMPLMVVLFIILIVISKNFKLQDVIVLVEILPLAFIGNKCGITQNGLLSNSYVVIWEKIENYSEEQQGNKYVIYYKTNLGAKKIFFKIEDKEEIKKYLLGIKKLKYNRK